MWCLENEEMWCGDGRGEDVEVEMEQEMLSC